MESMKNRRLKRTGLILLLAGMVGVAMTAAGMIGAYKEQATVSAKTLAEDISNSLLPATIGCPLVLAGLALFLLGWWNSRPGMA